MDTCENMVPMIEESSNEMPVEMPGDSDNEMHDDLNNVMPETNAENAEDRHVGIPRVPVTAGEV